MATISDLLVKLSLDSAEMRSGLKEATGQLSKFGSGVQGISKQLSTAFTFSALKQAGRVIKQLGNFVLDGAKAAAAAGDVASQGFLANLDKLKVAGQSVAAQAASQLAPALQKITSEFLNSKEAASALKDVGNFIANVFRVLASVGAVVAAVFDGVGKSIGAVASMIVDVLSGNFESAADTWRENAKDMEDIAKRLGKQLDVIWTPGKDFKGNLGKGDGGAAKADAYKLQLQQLDVDRQMKEKADSYGGISDTPAMALAKATSGFSSFGEALQLWADKTKQANEQTAEAAALAAKGQKLAAAYTTGFAEASKNAAAGALKAANAFEDAAKKEEEARKQEIEKRREAMGWVSRAAVDEAGKVNYATLAVASFANAVLQAVPRLNNLINAAVQGAQVGGVWGALIAVIVQLISETRGFQTIIDIVNADLDQLLNGLSPVVEAFAGLMEAVDPLSNLITTLITNSLQPLAPILNIIGTILGALILTLKPLNIIFNLVTMATQGIKIAFEWAKVGIMEAVEFFKALDPSYNKGPGREAIDAAKNTARESEAALKQMWENFKKDPFGDIEDLAPKVPEAVDKTVSALDKLTDSLTNVPEGFRVALTRYEASNPMASHDASMGNQQLHINIQGSVVTEGDLVDAIQKGLERKKYVKLGRGFVRSGS